MSILEHINSPAALKCLPQNQLPTLAGEIRQALIDRITVTGGHMGSNLGMEECNFFKSFGFDYFYVEDGNDVEQLLPVLRQVKDTPRPTVVHIHTQKDKGLAWAEADYAMPSGFDASAFANMESYDSITTDFLLKKMEKDPTVIAISPATATVTGLTTEFRQKAGNQFVDVGIAEEHAVAFASGLAKNGAKPITSSFLQRAYDQVIQDLALNGNPATILVYVNGLSPADATHCGVFDIPMLGNIPGLVCLAPAFKEEYVSMLDWAVEQTETPVIIRVPSEVISSSAPVLTDFTKYQTIQQGGGVAILGLGSFFHLAQEIGNLLAQKTGIRPTIINPRIFSAIDIETLEQLKTSYSIVITLEDGVRSGGFGEKIAAFYGTSNVKILSFGGDKEFTDRVPLEAQYHKYHLTPLQIVSAIENCMKGMEQ